MLAVATARDSMDTVRTVDAAAKDAANTQDTELAEQVGTHHVSLDDNGALLLPLYCF
jgi:hypothetical protein